MIIGIDGNEANIPNRVGVNQYAYEILWGMYRLQDKLKGEIRFIIYLKDNPAEYLPKEIKGYWEYRVIPGRGLWIITKLMPYLYTSKEKPDVIFSPHHYVPPLSPVPRVCTIHDLGYLNFSGQFKKFDFWQLKIWSAYSLSVSKRIIAVSNCTKEDIVRHYPSTANRISVVYHGYDKGKFNEDVSVDDVRRIKDKYHIMKDYMLFLSTLKPSKNIEGLLRAFSQLKGTTQLVIAGKKGWLYESIFKVVKELKIEDKVVFTDFVAEEDKAPLIKGAKAFILPSFWEGFGMDVVNAMAVGTPVVISDVASLPEVGGDAAIYVNPNQIESIRQGMEKVLSLPKIEYNMLIERGLKRARSFSWDKAAVETLEAIKKAI